MKLRLETALGSHFQAGLGSLWNLPFRSFWSPPTACSRCSILWVRKACEVSNLSSWINRNNAWIRKFTNYPTSAWDMRREVVVSPATDAASPISSSCFSPWCLLQEKNKNIVKARIQGRQNYTACWRWCLEGASRLPAEAGLFNRSPRTARTSASEAGGISRSVTVVCTVYRKMAV
jgi:hypothetical protein